jgi:hypothetical protein
MATQAARREMLGLQKAPWRLAETAVSAQDGGDLEG